MPPRETLQREEGRQEGEEPFVEGLRDRQAVRDDLAESFLKGRRDAEAGVREVEAAPQLEELEERGEEHAAGKQRHAEPEEPLFGESRRPACLERREERPPGEEEEERHVPERDEAAEDEEGEREVGVPDVVERRRVEHLPDVEREKQVGGEDAEPVDVGPAVPFHCLTPSRARSRRSGRRYPSRPPRRRVVGAGPSGGEQPRRRPSR